MESICTLVFLHHGKLTRPVYLYHCNSDLHDIFSFPNFFTMVGPGATWSNGTLLPSIETSVEYALKMIRKMQTEHIKSMEVKQEALDEIYAHFDEYHKTTVFQENCRSWFKDGKIKNRIYLWPGSVSHFYALGTFPTKRPS